MKVRISLFALLMILALKAVAQLVVSHESTHPTGAGGAVGAIGKPVARVNGATLTEQDLLRQMMIAFPYARQHGGRFPKEMEPGIRQNALQTIEFEELVYQEALRRKMTVATAKLTQAIADFKTQFGSEAEFQSYLQAEHRNSMRDLRGKVKRAILIDELLVAEVTRKSRVTPAQLRAFYVKNPERFRKPESVSIQTVSFIIPDNATAKQKQEVRRRAEEGLRQAKATKNYEEFGLLAQSTSEDDWRVMMGDHKSLHRGRMPPPVEKAAFSMSPGQISDIVETENAFCIVRLNAKEEAKLVPFQQVRSKLKAELEGRRMAELRKNLEAQLRKTAKIEEL